MMKSYEKMDSIVFVSEAAEKAFNEYTNNSFKNKGIIIKNVNNYDAIIRKSEEKTCLDDNNINIICVGRLTKTKDHARLVRIVKKINLRIDNVKLYILGVGKEESNIKNEIRRLGVRNIELLGYDPNPYKYIKQSDLFVCCSHNEGYNTATVEAVVLNTPIVTTDCAGMSEILDGGKYGLIVKDDDEALFDGMYRMIIDEKYRLAIKERQKRHIVSMMRDNAKNIADVEKIIRETSSSWK
jgi:glycosyltransferase involved in cell wall biosynthesis